MVIRKAVRERNARTGREWERDGEMIRVQSLIGFKRGFENLN